MDNEITISRVIDAPRERVFDAWTDPASLNAWWGPQGFSNTTESADIRPGGVWSFVMHSPDGTDYPNRITFQEIDRPERITYLHGEDEGKPRDFHTTVTFEDLGGRTRLTMRMVFASAELLQQARGFGAVEGGHSTIDNLTEFVLAEGDSSPLVITRIISAPVAAVWRAWSDPELIKQWFGPEVFTTPVARLDFREGGTYHFAMRDPDGNDYWSTGTYETIEPLRRIVYTDSFSDPEGNVISPASIGFDDFPMATRIEVSFEDLGGRTRMTVINSGMSRGPLFDNARLGWNSSMDKLAAAVLETA